VTLRRLTARLSALFRGRRIDEDLTNDMLAHLELAERDAVARGLPPDEARRAARLHFGGTDRMMEEHRDQRSARWLESLGRDLRHGLASAGRNPGFSAAVIGVLGLGIGANMAMFTIVDAALFKPLPFPEPHRIVSVWEAPRPGVNNATSTLDFLDWRRLSGAFDALAAEHSISVALTGSGEPARLAGNAVTADYFRVFGTATQLGRTFREEDEQPGAQPAIVLSHAAWKNYFGSDPAILGRTPHIDGQPHRIIGVLRPGAFDRGRAQLWKALVFSPEQRSREIHWLNVYGRLREETTPAQARERLQAIRTGLADAYPIFQRDWAVAVEPLENLVSGNKLRRSLSIAFGAVALVLLIACANVANLLLAKGASRRKELAVRVVLGAGRGRLVSQLLTESMVLCLLGGAAGIGMAALLIRAAAPVLADTLPSLLDISIDLRAAGFGAAIATAVSLLAGALPALRISFGSLAQPMNEVSRGSSGGHNRLRRMLVVAEVAVSLVLLCGALLLLRTLLNLQRLETGVRIENTITMSVDLPRQTYPAPERAALFYDAASRRLAAAPGVSQVALSSHLPLEWISNGEGLEIAGVEKLVNVRFKRVDPGYFNTFGIPVLAGRGITSQDRNGTAGVIVINEALRARLAGAAGMSNPVGQRVRLSIPHYTGKNIGLSHVEIVGVIRSERVNSPGYPDPPVAYAPFAQAPGSHVNLIVHSASNPASLMPAIREAMREIDPNLPLGDIATMQQVRERTLAGASRPAWLIGCFAAVAVLLAALGLYGVLSYAVAQQRREIGIRMALGARAGNVVSQVLRNAFALVLTGLLPGLLGAMALTRVMKGLLFEVSPLDPAALTLACGVMLLVALFAAFIPAIRAARVDPVTTLRAEG
jgi:putative ABC transport system permease protein